jgi:hypothetical protein
MAADAIAGRTFRKRSIAGRATSGRSDAVELQAAAGALRGLSHVVTRTARAATPRAARSSAEPAGLVT